MTLHAPSRTASPDRDRAGPLREALAGRYRACRALTERLSAPLGAEDQQLQSMPECSPTKWHRAHTTWFFETFVLAPQGVAPWHEAFGFLFNSYYEAAGPRHERPRRGLVSRPDVQTVGAYRRAVDERLLELLERCSDATLADLAPVIELGIAHEQQHQELILSDILHAFSLNPLQPAYRGAALLPEAGDTPGPLQWTGHLGGAVEIGHAGEGFAFDNEGPRHCVWLQPFALANRLITVGELKAFINDGGYRTPSLWLSDGIDWVRREGIEAPGHARLDGGELLVFGLEGPRVASDDEPAAHLSFYEADAIATWMDARLPTEAEWEVVAARADPGAPGLDDPGGDPLHPLPAQGSALQQLQGCLWQWTRSAYAPYPGYRPAAGALGEYNGKFMANQFVLRGGSFATPAGHVRIGYRNFWAPATRFQFSGLRLAKDL
ncbi:ergothioneine biosynthesis protein EgtB [Caldimonas tepidiphila]|uniref:ergothioneine biosynthesis protein EgtB n=1 Tax=Caldimonas tepidiphila TaxID=2315841 RepID=UPI000E5B8AFA|nr:ergothioneine biosynthesis protein EgtB [Caldimonas tepidiphila]